MRTTAEILWPFEKLPEWDAEHCFALFQRHQSSTLDEPGRNELTLQIMNLVGMHFGRNKTVGKLTASGLCAADLAQDIVVFIMGRLDRFKLQKPCYKTMIASFNLAITRRVADGFDANRGGVSLEVVAEAPAQTAAADPSGILLRLRRREVVEAAIRGLPGDLVGLVKCVRRVRECIIAGREVSAEPLPADIYPEQHAYIAAFLRSVAQSWIEHAAELVH